MADVVVAPAAVEDLERLIARLHLPPDTRTRVRDRLRQLTRFPQSGEALTGRWQDFRYIIGPWRWMLVVFSYDERADRVSVVTIQDTRTARSAKTR